ncbi:WD repeat-containing protein 43-like [Centruroides sculpturatus]|uniref:WD repeat-containing protein 43-like n=1 Tax=Centruroides sculpturatus TaxID=218467 RepID=UPI000C6ECACD|nr:WD repeat-containing protein 43-like [Centruroides sculpturatus]
MATNLKRLSLSREGIYLAYAGIDGRLKIWNTETGILMHEYTPSSHLSTTCTCLVWSPTRNDRREYKKKKKKRASEDNEEQIIAVGTTTGNILFFNVLKGELNSEMVGGHKSVINDIAWQTETDSLFSCSSDQYIVQWELSSHKIKYKWKADRHSIYSICLVDENTLLSASSNIKCWDLKNKVILKKFVGHATEVFCLLHVGLGEKLNKETSEGNYFFSSAINDRIVNVWQVRKESSSDSLAAFTLADEPVYLEVCCTNQRVSGVVFNYRSLFLSELDILLCGDSFDTDEEIGNVNDSNGDLLFENEDEDIMKSSISDEDDLDLQSESDCTSVDVTKLSWTTQIDNSKKCKTPLKPLYTVQIASEEGKNSSTKKKSLPILTARICPETSNEILIAYGNLLRPKFEKIKLTECNTHTVLIREFSNNSCNEEKGIDMRVFDANHEIMTQTIKMLPISSIQPLLKQLQHRLQTPTFANRIKYLKWLKTTLLFHTMYVSKCQELEDLLTPVSHLLASRSESFQKLLQLKGRLSVILSQMELRKYGTSEVSTEPLILHQEGR